MSDDSASITREELCCKKVITHPIGLLATWFGSGLAPKAPGTFGTFAALPFAWIIQQYLGNNILLIAAILISIIGVPICDAYMKHYNRSHDPKEVVIDEVAGMWLVLCFTPPTIIGYMIGFILFRIFDIWKPFPISWVDNKVGGGLGVMLDDIAAAVFAIIIIYGIALMY